MPDEVDPLLAAAHGKATVESHQLSLEEQYELIRPRGKAARDLRDAVTSDDLQNDDSEDNT